jgi:hypothetical protein
MKIILIGTTKDIRRFTLVCESADLDELLRQFVGKIDKWEMLVGENYRSDCRYV